MAATTRDHAAPLTLLPLTIGFDSSLDNNYPDLDA